MAETPPLHSPELTEADILAWLEAHPEFVRQHGTSLIANLPGKTDLGGNVVDLQGFMVGRLQAQVKEQRTELETLIEGSRENHSVQAQVHQAVLALVNAGNLEQLVEVLTTDLLARFGVDVIRLGIESPVADAYDVQYREQNYSGICFLPMGLTDMAIGPQKRARLIADVRKNAPEGFDDIFEECTGLVRSCALLRLQLPKTKRAGLIAFGVREPGHFHPRQGAELLAFLARVLEARLDQLLRTSDLEELLD